MSVMNAGEEMEIDFQQEMVDKVEPTKKGAMLIDKDVLNRISEEYVNNSQVWQSREQVENRLVTLQEQLQLMLSFGKNFERHHIHVSDF